MQSLKEFLGCGCRSHRYLGSREASGKDATPGYTFSWAKSQYGEERPVLPVHESLELSLNMEKEELSGIATIDFRVTQKEIQNFKINAVDLKVHDVQYGKRGQFQPVKFSVEAENIVIELQQKLLRGDQAQVKIVYSTVKPRAGIYFIKPDSEYPDRPVQVWTQGQDDDARFWFPCFDEPGIKCTYDVKVEVPSGFIATSNGALHSEVRGGKTWSFHWKTEFLIPSYLVTLTAGKFSEIKDDWRGKAVTYLVEKGREAEGKVSFGKTPKMMDLFSAKTGVDYPYEKYAQIAVAEFVFGGMENTSATTQTDATLHPLEIDEDFTSDDLVAHELAHQWFGDLVTCKSWAHGWLNEGWATFMEYVFKEHDMGSEEADYYRYEDLKVYLDEDSEFRRPIVTNYYADPAEVWDRHTYQKAGLVLQTLKAHLGEDDFWAGTKKYLETHRGGSVETVDFQRALESISGDNLNKFFDQWIFKEGYPEFKLSYEWDEKTKTAKVGVAQKQKIESKTSLFEVRTKIEFSLADKTKKIFDLNIKEADQNFYFPLESKPQHFLIDRGNHILKTVEWTAPQEITKSLLENDNDVVSKIWAMKALAKEGSSEGVELLISRLKSDAFYAVRGEAALALGRTKAPAAKSALLSALKEEKKAKVRSKICSALGNFKDDEVAHALSERLDKDSNIFVQGAAASSLGKTKHATAFEKLKSALGKKTWRDYVRAQVYVGLKHLYDEKALPLFTEGARYGAPKWSRPSAVNGMSDMAFERSDVRESLVDFLNDPYLGVKRAAVSALVSRKEMAATSSLEEIGFRAVDGHMKTMALKAAEQIRRESSKPRELHELRERVDKIIEENKKLQDRLDKVEQVKH